MIYGIKAGQLRSRVVIEANTSPSTSTNESGEPIETWEVWAVRTVGIQSLKAWEAEKAKSIYGSASHLITMRYIKGLTTLHRIIHEGRTFEITGILDTEERHRELLVYCTETPEYDENGIRNAMRFYDFPDSGAVLSGTAIHN